VKPQIEPEALDGRDASPHLGRMGHKDKPEKPAADSREAKLAQALRANLRRRKATGAAPPAPKLQEGSTD
jgi:hypothetical protein